MLAKEQSVISWPHMRTHTRTCAALHVPPTFWPRTSLASFKTSHAQILCTIHRAQLFARKTRLFLKCCVLVGIAQSAQQVLQQANSAELCPHLQVFCSMSKHTGIQGLCMTRVISQGLGLYSLLGSRPVDGRHVQDV